MKEEKKNRRKVRCCLTLLQSNLNKYKQIAEKRLDSLSHQVDLLILNELKKIEKEEKSQCI